MTEAAGGIKGVVVDGAIAPIVGAKVNLALTAGGNKTAIAGRRAEGWSFVAGHPNPF